jgi:hypothetical protein
MIGDRLSADNVKEEGDPQSWLVDVPRPLPMLPPFFSIRSAVRRPIAFDRKQLSSARSP